jgi:hypothetical protein
MGTLALYNGPLRRELSEGPHRFVISDVVHDEITGLITIVNIERDSGDRVVERYRTLDKNGDISSAGMYYFTNFVRTILHNENMQEIDVCRDLLDVAFIADVSYVEVASKEDPNKKSRFVRLSNYQYDAAGNADRYTGGDDNNLPFNIEDFEG